MDESWKMDEIWTTMKFLDDNCNRWFFGWKICQVEMYAWNEFQKNYAGWKPHVHGWQLQKNLDECEAWMNFWMIIRSRRIV